MGTSFGSQCENSKRHGDFWTKTKKVSARTKFTERQSTAHRVRLKQLLIEAFLGRKKCRTNRICPRASFFWIAQTTQIAKKTFFVSKCEKYKEHRGTAQQGRSQHTRKRNLEKKHKNAKQNAKNGTKK